jgi:hypothetical protein
MTDFLRSTQRKRAQRALAPAESALALLLRDALQQGPTAASSGRTSFPKTGASPASTDARAGP